MIRLHHSPSSASMAPQIVLEALGWPHELVPVDTQAGQQRSEEFLKLNPNGRVPVLEWNGQVIFETAAICWHLAEQAPEAGLIPAIGDPLRPQALKWMMWLTNTLQSDLILHFYPGRWSQTEAGAAEVQQQATARVNAALFQVQDQLQAQAAAGQPWFLGDRFSILDVYVFMLCRWTRHFDHPARGYEGIAPYLQHMLAQPCVARVLQQQGLPQPWV